jgi:hypothetical protein
MKQLANEGRAHSSQISCRRRPDLKNHFLVKGFLFRHTAHPLAELICAHLFWHYPCQSCSTICKAPRIQTFD